MPKYQTKPQRSWRYEKVARAEGEQCLACKIEKGIRRGPPGARLVVEHADNNPRNWAWSNLHLSCYSHNKRFEKLEVHEKISLLRSYGDQLEKEREREGLPTWRTVLKDELPYEDGSPEMKANRRMERRWCYYVNELLKSKGSELKKGTRRRRRLLRALQHPGIAGKLSRQIYRAQRPLHGGLR